MPTPDANLLFRALFANVSVGMVLLNTRGCVVAANPVACQLLGYTPQELRGRHFARLIHLQDRDSNQEAWFQSWLQGPPDSYVVEARYRRQDGATRWGRLTVSTIDATNGQPYRMVVCEDIHAAKQMEWELKQSRNQMQSLLVAMTDRVMIVDRSGQLVRMQAPPDLVSAAEKGLHQDLTDLFPASLSQRFLACVEQVLRTGQPQRLEYVLDWGPQRIWFDASVSRLNAEQVVWVARDISDRKHIEQALERSQAELRQSEQTYRLLFENNPHPLWVYDIDTLAFLAVNDAAIAKYGYSRQEFLTMTIADIRPQEDVPALIDNVSQVSEGLDEAGIWRHQTKDGQIIDVEITSHTLMFDGHPAELVLAHDITARRQAEMQLFRNTLQDELTHLPNRNLLTRRLQALINRGQQSPQPGYAVLFLDLDRFKVINDSLGHFVGDQVLMLVADKLRSLVRGTDVVARWGGDEFVILLEDINPLKGAVRLAERLVAEFQLPLDIGEREVFLGTSIGIVMGSDRYCQAVDLLRDADIAMYQAKAQGRNHYEIFDAAMHVSALRRLQLESELHQAIQKQELVVHYQPIISLTDGRPVGLEALVRWQHPQKGLLGPDSFITLAEEVGLISAMDRWVLHRVCQQLRDWQGHPASDDVSVAVNLSVQDLWNWQLVAEIEHLLREHQVDGRYLTLEITESMLVDDSQATTQLLTQLKHLGVRISIDDFGTGYSSLSYLHRLPVDALKIDRSFISQMQETDRNQKLVETIIALSRHLELRVIAEGIETEAHYRLLQRLGCDRGQGFWLAPPLPADQVLPFLQNWRSPDASLG